MQPRPAPPPTGDAPRWVYLLTALSVVAYVNLDCMDGKQVGAGQQQVGDGEWGGEWAAGRGRWEARAGLSVQVGGIVKVFCRMLSPIGHHASPMGPVYCSTTAKAVQPLFPLTSLSSPHPTYVPLTHPIVPSGSAHRQFLSPGPAV